VDARVVETGAGASRVAWAAARGYSTPMSRMGKRIVFGAVLIAVLAAVLWGDWRLEQYAREAHRQWYRGQLRKSLSEPLLGLPTGILMGVIAALAFLEIRRMGSSIGIRFVFTSGIVSACLLACCPYWLRVVSYSHSDLFLLYDPFCLFSLLLACIFAGQMLRRSTEHVFRDLGATVLAVAYVGGCGATALGVRIVHGVPAFVLFLVAAKFTDIGAYFFGSAIGRHKLIPWLSPGKSWEGLVGGVVVGAGACTALVGLTGWYTAEGALRFGAQLNIGQAGVFGAVVGLAGQFGDLCESLLKRSAGVKDSGAVVPEFGGVLDIIDSVLLSAPVAAVLLAILA
jgi:CDP-diglyceride synthetase